METVWCIIWDTRHVVNFSSPSFALFLSCSSSRNVPEKKKKKGRRGNEAFSSGPKQRVDACYANKYLQGHLVRPLRDTEQPDEQKNRRTFERNFALFSSVYYISLFLSVEKGIFERNVEHTVVRKEDSTRNCISHLQELRSSGEKLRFAGNFKACRVRTFPTFLGKKYCRVFLIPAYIPFSVLVAQPSKAVTGGKIGGA